jgi:hypothetical protein
MSCQRLTGPASDRPWMPAAMRAPIMPPQPMAEYQMVCRRGASARVYQKPVMSDSPGVTAASKTPRKKRCKRGRRDESGRGCAGSRARGWKRRRTLTII